MSSELIARAVGGDRYATAQLLAQHSSLMRNRLEQRLKLNPFADFSADDVLQEAFVDVYRGISTFDPQRGSAFEAWLIRVVDNRLAMFFRSRNRVKRGGTSWRIHAGDSSIIRLLNDIGDPSATTGSEHWAMDEAKQAIDLCIASLPNTQQEAVKRFYLHEEDLATVAASMAVTKEAVRGLLNRAKKSMRTMMGASSMWFR